jgi:hypothetical protein
MLVNEQGAFWSDGDGSVALLDRDLKRSPMLRTIAEQPGRSRLPWPAQSFRRWISFDLEKDAVTTVEDARTLADLLRVRMTTFLQSQREHLPCCLQPLQHP